MSDIGKGKKGKKGRREEGERGGGTLRIVVLVLRVVSCTRMVLTILPVDTTTPTDISSPLSLSSPPGEVLLGIGFGFVKLIGGLESFLSEETWG